MPLEVPVRFRGDELTDLIVLAIARRITKKAPFSDFGNAKIAKVVYDVADQLDLPITRSWYKFGTYVWSDYATSSRLLEFQNHDESNPEISYTIELSRAKDKETFSAIEKIVSKHKMLGMSLSAFLDELYERAPPKYRGLYKSHRKVLMRMQRIAKSLEHDDEIPEPQFLNASRDITAFQKEMFAFEDRSEMVEMVIDYTNLLEDLIVKYDELLDNDMALKSFVPFFAEVYRSYSDEIWAFPPSIITIETVKGENQDVVTASRNKHLAQLEDYVRKPIEMREQAFGQGFYPAQSEILHSQEKLERLIGSAEGTFKDHFTKAIWPLNQE